jgi:hypothetical protein
MVLNVDDLQAGINNLKTKFPVAVRRALKKAATSGRQAMVADMSADTGLPVGKVREAIKVVPQGDTQVNLECTGSRIPLIEFRARGPEPSRGRGRGVTYALPKGRGRMEHAFIATMPNGGHRGVFVRKSNAVAKKTEHPRLGRGGKLFSGLPIKEVFGPSLVRVFENHLPQGIERASEALTDNLRHEVDFMLSRR